MLPVNRAKCSLRNHIIIIFAKLVTYGRLINFSLVNVKHISYF